MSISVTGSRTVFGNYLRELRKKKGIGSPAELVRRMHGATSVSGVLKRERGELKITKAYIDAFAAAVRATAEEDRHLQEYLSLFQLQFDVWRSGKSLLKINREAASRLEQSEDIRCFSPTFVPHVLQTPAYTRGVLEAYRFSENERELARTLRVRVENADRICRESHRNVRLISSEAALYNIYGGLAAMLTQLNHLLKVKEEGHVQFRILRTGIDTNLPIGGTFTIHDSLFISAESSVGNLYTGDPEKGAWITQQFERLWFAATSGRERQEIVMKAIKFMENTCQGRNDINSPVHNGQRTSN